MQLLASSPSHSLLLPTTPYTMQSTARNCLLYTPPRVRGSQPRKSQASCQSLAQRGAALAGSSSQALAVSRAARAVCVQWQPVRSSTTCAAAGARPHRCAAVQQNSRGSRGSSTQRVARRRVSRAEQSTARSQPRGKRAVSRSWRGALPASCSSQALAVSHALRREHPQQRAVCKCQVAAGVQQHDMRSRQPN